MKLKDYDIGVIIGRFQVDELHDAHVDLINEVLSRQEMYHICRMQPYYGYKEASIGFSFKEINDTEYV